MAAPPSKQLDQFVVRLPDGMRDRIRDAAAANNRSMNAEIVATLEEKYPPPPPPAEAAFEAYQRLLKMFQANLNANSTPEGAAALREFVDLLRKVKIVQGDGDDRNISFRERTPDDD